MRVLRSGFVALVVALTLSGPTARAEVITELVAFGDSLTDTGNAFAGTGGTIPPSPPYFNGRFSNGPIYLDVLAQRLGVVPPGPSLLGGTNFAFGSATTALSGLSGSGAPNLGTQVSLFLGGAPTITPNQLFVISGGGNDFLFAGQANPTIPAVNIATVVSTLAAAGASQFLVLNLPPLGFTPGLIGTPAQDPFNALSAAFNAALDAELTNLVISLGIEVTRLDLFNLFLDVRANPAAFGIANVTDPAFNGISVAPDPNTFLFWDDLHPTATIHQVLGIVAANEFVPEPSTLALAGLALGGGLTIAVARRVRRGKETNNAAPSP